MCGGGGGTSYIKTSPTLPPPLLSFKRTNNTTKVLKVEMKEKEKERRKRKTVAFINISNFSVVSKRAVNSNCIRPGANFKTHTHTSKCNENLIKV